MTPPPQDSTAAEWVAQVDQMFMFYHSSGRTDLPLPDRNAVLEFFQVQAAEHPTLTAGIESYPPSPVAFDHVNVTGAGHRPPGVTNIQWLDLGLRDSPALVYCDIGTGTVMAHWPGDPDQPTVRLGTVFQPVHVEACDLDQDGNQDLIIADIGEFNANDSDLGQVVWLRRRAPTDESDLDAHFDKTVLLDGLSRVADVRPGDFDNDGDIDLLVAEFGWRQTGRIFLMVNEGSANPGVPQFSIREIDDRHGPIQVPTLDFNRDGHLDFIALIGQEHECVEVFLNDGKGSFTPERLWTASNPGYGSSGIELVDLDGDGDTDILYTNGDSFDRGAKPHHSVQWLENTGTLPFEHHLLCSMPGAMVAKAGDFDGDGDLDVIAAALLVGDDLEEVNSVDSSSIALLIQDAPGHFQPTQVESKSHQHLTLEVGDFNRDGKVDAAVGNFVRHGPSQSATPDLILLVNEAEDE
ncbi:FG-GAP repeat domain-containing protein [Allorhodopirellula solitaria]|uniref:FG-GAP repeat domain-containing protein n=1 Tax=Allorhodopirellula solitaria TaxID=2527987 RepID=UPI001FE8BD78|nr:VCBS repeat-containing protein [Allorhodopirellula solitaria]